MNAPFIGGSILKKYEHKVIQAKCRRSKQSGITKESVWESVFSGAFISRNLNKGDSKVKV